MKFFRMKCIWFAFMIICMQPYGSIGQSDANYNTAIQAKIKAVEENLGGWARTKDQGKWTLKERMKFYHIQGLSIAVIKDYKIDWAKGYQWANTAESIPVTPNTLFQASSAGLSLNAMALLKLAQEKHIDLNADINEYLTSWSFPYDSSSKNKKITVKQLLSHTAGLNVPGFSGYSMGDSVPTIIQVLNGQRPANNEPIHSVRAPGSKFEYSDGGTVISQLIVADVTKQPYEAYMKQAVLDPIGMNNSFYAPSPPENKVKMVSCGYENDGKLVEGKYHTYPELAPGGLWTTPSDIAKFIIETQLSYKGQSQKVLSAENTKLRLTPLLDSTTAALGTFLVNKGNLTYFHHFGRNDGFVCEYFGSFEGGNGVVIMANSENAGILDEIANSVSVVYGWPGFYSPVFKTVANIPVDSLKIFEGRYRHEFVKGEMDYLQFKVSGQQLILKQSWDQAEFTFLPESGLDFFTLDMPFKLSFKKNKEGVVTHALAFGRDLWEKMPVSQGQKHDMKTLE